MKSSWIAVILILSLALNLAMAGFLLGSRSLQAATVDPTRAYPRWARALPPPRRDALLPVVTKHMRAIRPQLQTLRRQHRALQAAIIAEPFDANAVHDTLADMRGEHERVQRASHESFAEFVAQLTPAERQELVRDMGERKHPPQHRRTDRPPR